MSEKIYKCDFHSHPLCHRYYPDNGRNKDIVLTEHDKAEIRAYVDWAIGERELDVIGITDHDLIQSSLYAREYVKENNLPAQIVTGAECEIYIQYTVSGYKTQHYAHILVIGVDEIPNHQVVMTVEQFSKFADDVRNLGGMVVMAHPVFSEKVFYMIAEYLDGFETLNRDMVTFYEGARYAREHGLQLKEFQNSDFHAMGSYYNIEIPIHINYESEEFVKKLVK